MHPTSLENSMNYVKDKCFEYYQPLQHLSVDKRMVQIEIQMPHDPICER